MRILVLNTGPYGSASHGAQVVMNAISSFGDVVTHVMTRDLARSPLPPISHEYASAITSRAPNDSREFELSERLIGELEQSELLFIITPMHNFTVSSALKLWIDYVVRINRSFKATPAGKVGLLKDRPTFVIIRSGAIYTGAHARQADFLTPYLQYVLSTIGIKNVQFFTLGGVSSAAREDELAAGTVVQRLLSSLRGITASGSEAS